MHTKKSLTSSLRLRFDTNDLFAPALPAAFCNALKAAPGRLIKTNQTARGAKTGVHVTKTKAPRGGHR